MFISIGSLNPSRVQFETAVKKALFQMGPGEPCWLNIPDDEFYKYYGDSPESVTKQDGILSRTIEAWGGRVYVTCPRLSGRELLLA